MADESKESSKPSWRRKKVTAPAPTAARRAEASRHEWTKKRDNPSEDVKLPPSGAVRVVAIGSAFTACVVGLIVLAGIAWRKGWLGKETEDKIKDKRDKLLQDAHALTQKLEALALSKFPVSAGTSTINTAAGIAELKDMLARGVITQAQYDDSIKKLMGL